MQLKRLDFHGETEHFEVGIHVPDVYGNGEDADGKQVYPTLELEIYYWPKGALLDVTSLRKALSDARFETTEELVNQLHKEIQDEIDPEGLSVSAIVQYPDGLVYEVTH